MYFHKLCDLHFNRVTIALVRAKILRIKITNQQKLVMYFTKFVLDFSILYQKNIR